jgi:hypothetical protein
MSALPADTSESALVRSLAVMRIATFSSLAIYLAVIHLVTPPATSLAPRGFSTAALTAVIVLALAAVALRSAAQSIRATAERRVRAALAVYVVAELLGVVALLIWAFEGDVRQATGCILGAAIFAAGGFQARGGAGGQQRESQR